MNFYDIIDPSVTLESTTYFYFLIDNLGAYPLQFSVNAMSPVPLSVSQSFEIRTCYNCWYYFSIQNTTSPAIAVYGLENTVSNYNMGEIYSQGKYTHPDLLQL